MNMAMQKIFTGAMIAIALAAILLTHTTAGLLSTTQTIPSNGTITGEPIGVTIIVPDDYPDIQSAINAIPAGEFGDVLVRAGHWVLNPASEWPPNQIVARSNLYLHGEGIDKTIIEFTTADAANVDYRADVITSVGDVNDFTLADLTVTQHAVPDNMGSGCVYLREGVHRNIAFLRVKVTDGFGGGLNAGNVTNLLIEDCIVERCWSGILIHASFADIRRNIIRNIAGDGIFPQWSCKAVNIDYNTIESIGDLAIDITADEAYPAHQGVKARHNIIKHGSMRVSRATDTQIIDNSVEDGCIDIDNGAGPAVNTLLEDNGILSSGSFGIGFFGAQGGTCRRNTIRMLPPAEAILQTGIIIAIWTSGLIEENIIIEGDDGIDFGGWTLGSGNNITIRSNTIQDFRNFGIYDDNLHQETVYVEDNTFIYNANATAIFVENPANHWIIDGNIFIIH